MLKLMHDFSPEMNSAFPGALQHKSCQVPSKSLCAVCVKSSGQPLKNAACREVNLWLAAALSWQADILDIPLQSYKTDWMCLESWCERTVNYTKIVPNRAWGRDRYRNTNRRECNLEIRVYPFYLCSHYLPSASISGISATFQHRRQESWAPGFHTKCGPVPSSSDAEPKSLCASTSAHLVA